MFDDLSEAEIAERLSISPHTVHQYMKRLYRKTGVTSRPQLIVRVVAEHLHLNPALPVGGLE
ncbi:MAG: helix-turn-helix transcriptional regulator [Gemmatimonadetes bacterium]|nr:helix-turn-helix transcriptional regulator [Gemmatimonadota bacterium]